MKTELTIGQEVCLWTAVIRSLRDQRQLLRSYYCPDHRDVMEDIVCLRHLRRRLRPSYLYGVVVDSRAGC